MFHRVLIANRGEIAVRVAQALQQMGITAVAVYSDPDRRALHVQCADEAYPLDGSASSETYLRQDKIIDIARSHGIDAIHPGYGFLSENADFAQACANAGITFIGPSPQVIREMGDKIVAKEKFKAAGVPVVPGWSGPADVAIQRIRNQAAAIGFPVMVKAASGGGGKGMRVVLEEKDLPQAMESAQREASAAFGDGRVFLEKYIARPRHVEFQIFGDSHGNVVHLFERECSIQRRHQKIIEESPSPALTPELREKMAAAAVRAAQAIGYCGAGTVEFMVDEKERKERKEMVTFYFLEVNTRLQVEHPVTEMVTRHDLVRAQILVAAGEPLPFTQGQIDQGGHALECRVYAEDPANGFLPSVGMLEHYGPPVGPNIRVDSGVAAGSEVFVYYDPMLAKVIVWGRDRAESLARMDWALSRFAVLGVTTNIAFLRRVLAHRAFQAGRTHTQFLEEHDLAAAHDGAVPVVAVIAAVLAGRNGSAGSRSAEAREDRMVRDGPWQAAGPWRALP